MQTLVVTPTPSVYFDFLILPLGLHIVAIASSQLSGGAVAAAGALTPAVAAVCTSPRRRHATTTGLSGVLVRDLQMLLLRAVVQWHHLSAVGGADAAAAHDLDSGVGVFAVDPDLI